MAQEGVKNLALDLEYHASVLVGHWVVAAATAAGATQFTVRERWAQAVVPYVGANDAANFTDARVVFRSGANQGFSTVVASVASTVSGGTVTTTVTVKDALPNALAAGDGFTIYRALAIAVTAPENIQEVGGTPVPTPGQTYSGPVLPVGGNDGTYERPLATDATGRVKVVDDQAQGAPGTAAPAQAVQVAGTDGANLRGLLTTPNGRLNQAVTVATVSAVAETANTNFATFTAPHDGVATLLIAVSTATTVSLVGLGTTAALNSGGSLAAAQWYTFQFPVAAGQSYSLQVGTAATVSCQVVVNTTG